jgi:predicted SPOUT superfamily RNA methylase MTH1
MSGSVDISVAIPDSSLSDEQTLRDKTMKISQIARASSIFRVKTIYLYQDRDPHAEKADRRLIKVILRYLDTPQYLRKTLFPQMQELRYAGLLPPIKAPHHKEWQSIKLVKEGEIRVGVVVKVKDKLFVDVGLGPLVQLEGEAPAGVKLNVRLKSSFPNLRAEEIDRQDISSLYWGFQVHEAGSLKALLDRFKNSVVVITSRRGNSLKNFESQLLHELTVKRAILLVFGSPRRGVTQILSSEGYDSSSYQFIVNMFPYQGTDTVRLEEAILGTLAITNCFLNC